MTDAGSTPQEGVAHALTDLSEQTLVLVRQEVDAAQQEIIAKAKRWMPAAGLFAVAAGSGLFATASLYRLATRILEKLLPPTVAALVASAGFGTLAVVAGGKGVQKVRDLPPPAPTETARDAASAVSEAARDTRRTG